jgi:hypothetical protein
VFGEEWSGVDSPSVAEAFRDRTSQQTRFIKAANLRLLPSQDSPTGSHLYCVANDDSSPIGDIVQSGEEKLERVWQISLEMTQGEMGTLSIDVLKEMALCCFNDLRSIYLVNDQRLLGVLSDEIDNLVHVRGAISAEEGEVLRAGVVPSFLPSSIGWKTASEQAKADSTAKNEWVLKTCRGGFGLGHVFGTEVANEEWLKTLKAAEDCNSHPSQACFLLQKRLDQVSYDLPTLTGLDLSRSWYITGSYSSIGSKYVGLTGFRVGDLVPIRLTYGGVGVVMMALTDLTCERSWLEKN